MHNITPNQENNELDTMLEEDILWTESLEANPEAPLIEHPVEETVEETSQQIEFTEKQKKEAMKRAKEAEKEALRKRKELEKKNRPPTVWEKALKKYWFLLTFFVISLIFYFIFSYMEGKFKEVFNNLDMESNSIAMDMDAEKAFLDKWSGNSVKVLDTPKVEEAYNNIGDAIVLMQQFVDNFGISVEDTKMRLIVKKQLLDSEKIALMMLKYQSENFSPKLINGLWPKDVEVIVEVLTTAQRKSLKQKEEDKLKEQLEENKKKDTDKKTTETTTTETENTENKPTTE